MEKRKKRPILLVGLVVTVILGTVVALMNTVNSESEIIGGGDKPTDIWIGDE